MFSSLKNFIPFFSVAQGSQRTLCYYRGLNNSLSLGRRGGPEDLSPPLKKKKRGGGRGGREGGREERGEEGFKLILKRGLALLETGAPGHKKREGV
jgi:hypothetical protein